MAEKRYYWLKLKDDFFDSIRIKKLRSLAGGDTFTIIYLKMLLKAMKNDGILKYQGVENNICNEIALDLNEQADNVEVTLKYLLSCGLAEEMAEDCFLPEAVANVGSEQNSTERVRRYRAKQALQCNADVTDVKQLCNTEIRDKREEIEKERDVDVVAPQPTMDEYKIITDAWNAVPHTVNIQRIIPLSSRDDNLRRCINQFGLNGVLEAIQKIKDSPYLAKRGHVSFDAYMTIDVMTKTLEGSYDVEFKEGNKNGSFWDD